MSSWLVKQGLNESERSIWREVSAWDSPMGMSTEMLELPWMRPSEFQVLWPCRTSTTRSGGSDAPGRGRGELFSSRKLEQQMQEVAARPRPHRPWKPDRRAMVVEEDAFTLCGCCGWL